MTVTGKIEIRPQPGPQELFLSSPADIAIYGGGAFGGKTWALTIEPLRHVNNKQFSAVFFRRTYKELTNPGGVWDEMRLWYPYLGGKPNRADMLWTFPSGMRIVGSHLQYEDDAGSWAGAQVPLINFDQLEQFTRYQFFFMMSRNRSGSGVPGYIRATCNPDPDSWLAKFIAWWIDEETGYAIPERAGRLRYFVQVADQVYWADNPNELISSFPGIASEENLPKSVTFVPSLIDDNPIGLAQNPGYKASLLALPLIEQERLLKGNWKIRPAAGKVFNKDWFELVNLRDVPLNGAIATRYFDTAGTEKKIGKPDPDYTAGCLIVRTPNDLYFVMDSIAQQIGPAAVEQLMVDTAKADYLWAQRTGVSYSFHWELEPGDAAMRDAAHIGARLRKEIPGIIAFPIPSRSDKLLRSKGLAVASRPDPGERYGRVKVVRGEFTERWLNHMHNIPDGKHDDEHDAAAGSYNQAALHAFPEPGRQAVRLRR
jgi:phage terminase large subunit-like protein